MITKYVNLDFQAILITIYVDTKVVQKQEFILSGRICDAICRNSTEAHIFCSALSSNKHPSTGVQTNINFDNIDI